MQSTKKFWGLLLAALLLGGVWFHTAPGRMMFAAAETETAAEQAASPAQKQKKYHKPSMDWLRPGSDMGMLPAEPTEVGNTFSDAPRNILGLDAFCPPLIRLTDPVDFAGSGGDADSRRYAGQGAAFAAAVDRTAEAYFSAAGRSFGDLHETQADPAEVPVGAYAASESGLYGGYTLFCRPEEDVLVTVSKNFVLLSYGKDSALSAAVSLLEEPAAYGETVAADPYFKALASFYGVEAPMRSASRSAESDRLPTLTFFSGGENTAQAAEHYYADSLRVFGRIEDGAFVLGAMPNDVGTMGVRSTDFTAYDFDAVKEAADAVCTERGVSAETLLEATVVWYYDRAGLYRVPAYRFCYLAEGDPAADETLTVFYVDLPAYDLYLYATQPPTLKGDADNDGEVTVMDARLVLRAVVGLEPLDWEQVCDMDDDGELGITDARDVLRVSVGLPIGEEERRLAEEAESRRQEKRAEEESRRIAEEESLSREEESRKAAEEASRKAAEEESRRAAEEERRRREEEALKRAEEEKRNAEKRRADWLASFPKAISYGDLKDNMSWFVNDVGQRSWWNSTQNSMANRIYERLVGYGFTGGTCKKLDFVKNGITGRNVMAVIPTAKKNPEILLVMAHYDTARGIGGAVDNSSGAVALLQLAKRFKATGEDYGVEVRFLFTAGEEQGYYGAYAYVNALSSAEKNRHFFTFNMDMVGKPNNKYEPGRAYYLAVSTEPVATDGYYPGAAKANVGSRAVDAAKAALGNLGEDGYYCPVRAGVHDIVPFRKAGMPALTLSWRCIASHRSSGADHGLASPYFIHTSEDSIYYFDMDSLYNTTRLVAASLARLLLPYTGH